MIVRNTGHDYNGKSTGAGGLGLWMSHLKDIEIRDWSDEYYVGKVIKMSAGVQGFEAYAAADSAGLQIVGGECPTVGIVGGYSQGGGHSALTSKHGLVADQAIEWEVMTATGEHLFANRQENTDLYWALFGDGGGTYGVVLSLTSKAHQDTRTHRRGKLDLHRRGKLDLHQRRYIPKRLPRGHCHFPCFFTRNGGFWHHECLVFHERFFCYLTAHWSQHPVAQLHTFLKPLKSKLDELNITYTSYFGQFDSYLQHFNHMFAPIEVGIAQYGDRLIPRSVVNNNNEALTDAFCFINDQGGQIIRVGINASLAGPAIRTMPSNQADATPFSISRSRLHGTLPLRGRT